MKLFLSIIVFDVILCFQICPPYISDDITALKKQITNAVLGKIFIAKKYDAALIIQNASTYVRELNPSPIFHVIPCSLDTKRYHESNRMQISSSGIYNITVWARLVGPEIFTPTSVTLTNLVANTFAWVIRFPEIRTGGQYRLEILSIWINSLLDVDENNRGLHTTNHPDSQTVHLGGIGNLRNRSFEPPNVNDIRLNDGDPERQGAHVYGSPMTLHFRKDNNPLLSENHSLPPCFKGFSEGRWVREAGCQKYDGNASLALPPGHECWQTDIAYQGLGLPAPVRTRESNMVWRPYTCRLAHYQCHGCPPADNKKYRLSKKRQQTMVSEAAQCLLGAGVGVIAGFGDSLGTEQRNNIEALLGGQRVWKNDTAKGWLECDDWVQNHHWLSDYQNLAKCLEKQARKLLKSTVELRTVVLVTNFNIHHGQWKGGFSENEAHLRRQEQVYSALRQRLASLGLRLRLIWFAGVAVHGFRVPGLTLDRQARFNRLAEEVLGRKGGWEVLDSFAMTVGRPDGTQDGVHYRGGVSKAVTTVLMNMICNQK